MVYKVIGLMSGSSLDGLDIVYTHLDEVRGKWSFEIICADCIPYSNEMAESLQHVTQKPAGELIRLHTSYGRYLGEKINEFIAEHQIEHQVHFIASHGHTVFHDPANNSTYQVGDGATIAAVTGLPVISDLRSLDVALGGQGAPIVPVGDKLLFGGYDYWLNIGGIANITVMHDNKLMAFDVCPANQALNKLAEREGKVIDEDGAMAASGRLLIDVLDDLNAMPYYRQAPPKSLSNEAAISLVFPDLFESGHDTNDMLHTVVQHIAEQIAAAVKQFPHHKEQAQMLATGGGVFNTFLIDRIKAALAPLQVNVVVPDTTVIKFKEALVMALIGALRWREETNVFSGVTGASRDSISGAVWMGHSYGE